ncbi:UNVERIFIED_CONTAM: hypothetical protein Sradi_7104400 [Sesamum radiatum]|uniref:Uncharacterized protein n=1 Tax=Sesamum radiatum TaxID=300843 RepID=A0AAW2J1Y1_SESRA
MASVYKSHSWLLVLEEDREVNAFMAWPWCSGLGDGCLGGEPWWRGFVPVLAP